MVAKGTHFRASSPCGRLSALPHWLSVAERFSDARPETDGEGRQEIAGGPLDLGEVSDLSRIPPVKTAGDDPQELKFGVHFTRAQDRTATSPPLSAS